MDQYGYHVQVYQEESTNVVKEDPFEPVESFKDVYTFHIAYDNKHYKETDRVELSSWASSELCVHVWKVGT